MRKRVVIIAINVAVLLTLVGGTAAFAALNKTVTLSVDGKETQVRTFGSKVSDVLESKKVKLAEHDVVAPAKDAAVKDGSRVAVRYGRQLAVTVDGEKKTYWVTADNVSGALDQLGLRVQDAKLSTSRSATVPRKGLSLTITTAKAVSLRADGDTKQLSSTSRTVGEVLDEAKVKLDGDDEVKPAATTPVDDGAKVVVTRIKNKTKAKIKSVDFDTDVRKDSDMDKGETEVVTKGEPGSKKVTYKYVIADGRVRDKKVVSSTVVSKPKTQVESVGTKEAEEAPEPSGGSNFAGGDSVWDRLAKCESGGNWATNTGNGYYGGLQFSASSWSGVGGSGLPHQASREEQIKRGKILKGSGGWGQWPACSAKLGLR